MSRRIAALVAIVVSAAGYAPGGISSTIDTTVPWDGLSGICCLGTPNAATATFGEIFTVGADNILQDFSFWLRNQSSPQGGPGPVHPDVVFDAYIMQWAGDRAIGSPLYQSLANILPFDDHGQYQMLTFVPNSLQLTSGGSYVAFLNTSPYGSLSSIAVAQMGAIPGQAVDNVFYFQDSHNRFENVTQFPWLCGDEGHGCRYGTAAFRATFAPGVIPEPATLALVALGLAGLGFSRRRCAS